MLRELKIKDYLTMHERREIVVRKSYHMILLIVIEEISSGSKSPDK